MKNKMFLTIAISLLCSAGLLVLGVIVAEASYVYDCKDGIMPVGAKQEMLERCMEIRDNNVNSSILKNTSGVK